MAYQAGEVVTEQRSLAKIIKFQVSVVATGVGTFSAVSILSDDIPQVAGAVTSGLAGVLTDAVFTAMSATKIGFELKDGYARRFVGAKAICRATSGAGNLARGQWTLITALTDGQVTANGHVAAMLTVEANSYAAAAGTIVLEVEFMYE